MKHLQKYITETLGMEIGPEPIQKQRLGNIPVFIGEIYRLYDATLFEREVVLAEQKRNEEFSILQTEKHFRLLKETFHKVIILVMQELPAYNRKRLIEKGINFIVPGKQLYLPELLIDLRESFKHPRAQQKKEKLLPSAQFILIYHILHRNDKWRLEDHSFKDLAARLGYTAMAVTKAIENLKYHEVVDVAGEKEKFIRFKLDKAELWRDLEQRKLWTNPVLKRVFVDEKPKGVSLLHSNTSALPEYTDMNPGRQEFYAIEKTMFYSFVKNNALINANETEGRYCLEVWKYSPTGLTVDLGFDGLAVDPLSLYLSLNDGHDERTEMALKQIIEKYIW